MLECGRRVPVHERGPERTYRPDMRAPTLHGSIRPGSRRRSSRTALVGGYDATATLEAWTATAEALMRAAA